MSASGILSQYRKDVTEDQSKKLDVIAENLCEKNKVMNLTAITDEKGVALLHFWDSLTLIDTGLFTNGKKVIDVGCGAGFPSLPLAVCAPGCSVTANDATAKKLAFVLDTAKSAGIENLDILNGRAEELACDSDLRESFDIAVSRGVARLNVLCEWCLPFVKAGGYFIAMKGEKYAEEVSEAENAVKTLGGKTVDIIKFSVPEYGYLHTLVVIEKTGNTPSAYPRQNGKILKKPL
ncbi:MAG: 16S rRNA (guanine(527)-N(7))-methyltransferase RsmG [Clostridia bacterium]|nr:16S rRNA (guanine(527)-N(7))-methyltransferase RsmG [Clostridia bacterium]